MTATQIAPADEALDIDLDAPLPDAPANPAPATAEGNTLTERQAQFIKKLGEERALNEAAQLILRLGREEWAARRLTKRAASGMIEALLSLPRDSHTPAAREAAEPAPEGLHYLDGTPYRVRTSKAGHPYAEEVLRAGGFNYAPGVVARLSEATVMTLEQAAEFGKAYGTCARCGRTLTNPESIDRGIGPICAGRF